MFPISPRDTSAIRLFIPAEDILSFKWAQTVDGLSDIGGRGKWGLWQLNISDFVVNGGPPSLQNTISYKPGGILGDFTWCESHDWTKNDSVVIFSMNSEGQHENYMDLYTLNIYDMLGREVRTLVNEFQEANTYSVTFDPRELASGLYFYRLQAGMNGLKTKKMLLVK